MIPLIMGKEHTMSTSTMSTSTMFSILALTAFLSMILPTHADQYRNANELHLQNTFVMTPFIELAALPRIPDTGLPDNLSPWFEVPEDIFPFSQKQTTIDIQIAGQCGSSIYYCNNTGASYCCGSSSDGFYCAKDVNGCTR